MSIPAALFVPLARPGQPEHWLPTDLARGPWDPSALHGGPVAALLARAVEGVAPAGAFLFTRFTLELLRPVPVSPLALTAGVTRPGRRVQLVEAELTAEGRAVARCRALRLRLDDTLAAVSGDGPEGGPEGGLPPRRDFPGPGETVPAPPVFGTSTGFHNAGAELRFARGVPGEPGPSTVWVRLAVPVVPGELPTPLQRTVAAADFGNGVSATLPFHEYTFINADLTVCCARLACGEWIAIDAVTELGAPGVGLARSLLWDDASVDLLGSAVQCLLVDRR